MRHICSIVILRHTRLHCYTIINICLWELMMTALSISGFRVELLLVTATKSTIFWGFMVSLREMV